MSITASCGNCGKTYQAPERMAGKVVRCKACGEIFRVSSPTDPEPSSGGGLDLDALERSFSDADATSGGSQMATKLGTNVGPSIDAHGRPRIERDPGVEAMHLGGGGAEGVPAAMRSNFRYRYPGAKQIDQFLPWALVIVTLFVIVQASLSTDESVAGESLKMRPPTGVAISRAALLIALYVIIVWPASHLGLSIASQRMRFAMPRGRFWRTFSGFMPVLMLGGGLFILSGGEPAALIMGLLVGIALAVGAVAVLFRVFPNEVPVVGGFAAGGSVIGAAFSIALMVAINLIAVSIAKTQPDRSLKVSPIAVGLNWPALPEPALVAKAAPKPAFSQPTLGNANGNGVSDPSISPTPPGPATLPNGEVALESIGLPVLGAGEHQLIRAVEVTPVKPGFDSIIVPPVTSQAIAVVRVPDGGQVETWNRSTWLRPTAQVGRNFDATRSPIIVSPSGKRVVRLVTDPVDRIEELPLGNIAVLPPTRVSSSIVQGGERAIVGMLDEGTVLCSLRDNNRLGIERYSIVDGKNVQPTTMLKSAGLPVVLEADTVRALRLAPDGRSLIIAAREMHPEGAGDARLLRYDLNRPEQPQVACEVLLNRTTQISPIGLSLDPTGSRVALLLNTGSELNLTVWDMTPPPDLSAVAAPLRSPLLDRKIGLLTSLRPNGWSDAYEPILWIDGRTLLVYGRILIDAQTGRSLGETNIINVIGQVPGLDAEGRVLLIQNRAEGKSMIRVTLDMAAINAARE